MVYSLNLLLSQAQCDLVLGFANELRKSNDRREELVARQKQSGPNKLIERELNQALIAAQVLVVQDLIAQVSAHRATVPA